ncbi:MAG: ABC transporter ATP-binding protein/permease [Lachnospiraceae bacterium]|nr:ABC transporter ATP-binding protein/permease [Lachnospiraceae bacterium]
MKNILRFMRGHGILVLCVVVLLVVQAYSELSLPDYTGDIINIGLQRSGIEDSVPVKIRPESLEMLKSVMNDADASYVENSYSVGTVRELKSGADRSKLDKIMAVAESDIYAKMMPDSGASVKGMEDQVAVYYVMAEYKALDVNVDKIRNAYLLKVGLRMLLMSAIMMAAGILTCLLASVISARVGRDLRQKVFSKVMTFSGSELGRFESASLITRATNDIQQVQNTSVIFLRMVAYSPILAIGGIINVVNTRSGMGWIIVVAVACLMLVVGTLMVIAMPKFKIMQKLIDNLNLVSRQLLTGVMPIRAFSREAHEEERFDKANDALYKNQMFTNVAMSFMMPVMMFIMNGVSVLIVWVGADKIDKGNIQIGDLTAFITYSMTIVTSFLIFTMISIILPRACVAADRIAEVLDTKPLIEDGADAKSVKKEDIKGVVRFDHVSFAFPDAKEQVLTDIDFIARPGETTAIIGSTGSGKSALINLIPRFFDVTEGSVTIDGEDIRSIKLKDLRELIGYVPQKAVLFSGTIDSNIRYADGVSTDDMKEASKIAQASEFISAKEDGYDSSVAQSGTNVSGGQRQRLSIARAIAKKPKIYIFDDSFSALDYATDKKLRSELKAVTKDATVIIVAQRISTILDADRIIVLDEGRIVGMGRHEELLHNCKEYDEIATSQLSEDELRRKAGE